MDMARYESCYLHWIAGQEAGLAELESASANAASGHATDAELRAAVERCMQGYQDYATRRRALSREAAADGSSSASAFFAPPWCTAFENSVLWLGGCRPSLAVRLLYNLSGEGLEAHVAEMLGGHGGHGGAGGDLNHGHGGGEGVVGVPAAAGGAMLGITCAQLRLINDLHGRTVHRENDLSDRLATLQEDVADRPLLPIVRRRASAASAAVEVDAALDSYEAALARLLAEADELRMATARALATEILTPRQAVEMLAAGKQLHLTVREWSRRREGGGAGGARQRLVNGPPNAAGPAGGGSTSGGVVRSP